MNMQKNCTAKRYCTHRLFAGVLSAGALLLGLLYYCLFRQTEAIPLLSWLLRVNTLAILPLPIDNQLKWLPSLLHAFATFMALHAFLTAPRAHRWIEKSMALCLLIVLEFALGTTDVLDLVAVLAGVMLAEVVIYAMLSGGKIQKTTGANLLYLKMSRATHTSALAVVLVSSGLLAAGSYSDGYYSECAYYDNSGYCTEYKRRGYPIYMSYQQLRESVRIEPARDPDRLGRVYLYQEYIFLNEKNEGIHIIDNSNPASPVNVGFINIPGNTEIAIRDNYLYADSYVDLITLSLQNPADIQIVNRQENIFPYDAFQNIPYNVSLSSTDIDRQHGVVVSYQLSGV